MIVGKLRSLEHIFGKFDELKDLYAYLNACLDTKSAIHQRIEDMPTSTSANEKSYMLYDKRNVTIRAIEQTYMLKDESLAFYETHRRYVDFQLCVSGREYIEVGDFNDFSIKAAYDEEKDLIIYSKLDSTPTSKLLLTPGDIAIFFPNDVHAGGLRGDIQSQSIKKSVVKVSTELLKHRI